MVSGIETVLQRVAQEFDKLRIRYVIGGSLASSLYGIPRATQDADILADLQESDAERLITQLEIGYLEKWAGKLGLGDLLALAFLEGGITEP